MRAKTPHPLNAPGDFYVEDGCCTSCEVPFQEAPGHFAYDTAGHCYVCKQPSTGEDVERMVKAVNVAELDCIRYGGNDRGVVLKLVALGEGAQCDALVGPQRESMTPHGDAARDVVEQGATAATTHHASMPRKVWWAFWRR